MERRKFTRSLTTSLGALSLTNGFGQSILSSQNKKLGIALVGLGNYATRQLAPALLTTKLCELKAIVTGTPSKAKQWKKNHDLKDHQIYDYDNFDTIVNNEEIDIVYVVLPNNMHKDFTIRAFKAGKHVICEKPMAMNAQEAAEMVAAAKEATFCGIQITL
jgi:glucose-fructose oxidoreductase